MDCPIVLRLPLLAVSLFSSMCIASNELRGQETPSQEISKASIEALQRARELIAGGDSIRATALLKDAAARDPDNGPLWYEYGRLLSARTRFAWRKGMMPAGIPNLVIAAETSLARASRLAPDSIHYAIDYGRHLWGTNSTSITRATNVQKNAVDQLADAENKTLAANAADNVGMMLWRRFEVLIGRGNPTWQTFPIMPGNPKGMMDWVKENFARPTVMYGVGLYNEAAEYLRYARISDPDSEMYFRHEMMLMAEGERWLEMGAVSRERIRQRPTQPWPWLVLGTSEHRLGRTANAQAAFDSGFARLPTTNRERLESLLHILPQKRREWYQSLTSDSKLQLDEVYWNTANPSMLLPANPLHAEFRARAVYAELRSPMTSRWFMARIRRKASSTFDTDRRTSSGPPATEL